MSETIAYMSQGVHARYIAVKVLVITISLLINSDIDCQVNIFSPVCYESIYFQPNHRGINVRNCHSLSV